MKYLFFLFLSISLYAQNIVSGKTVSEQGYILQNVLVINMRTNKQINSNNDGSFSIQANINDELRFVKDNYERVAKKISIEDFSNPISVRLVQAPTEIEEVKLAFNPTGDINKDINFNSSKKMAKLNKDIAEYVKKPMAEIRPKNSIPSSFAPRDPYAGQLNLLSISFGDNSSGGILGLLLKESLQKQNLKLNLSEKENFYKKVKENFYGKYFEDYGLDEFKFESYLIYLDNKYGISAKYYDDFNKLELEKILKNSLKEFTK